MSIVSVCVSFVSVCVSFVTLLGIDIRNSNIRNECFRKMNFSKKALSNPVAYGRQDGTKVFNGSQKPQTFPCMQNREVVV